MANTSLDVVGVGNAIVDVIARADESDLTRLELNKGTMTLIDDVQAERLYSEMNAGVETSGGSAANTLAGIASLGGRGAYIGKVLDDQLGAVFINDIKAAGVDYPLQAATEGPSTARCLIEYLQPPPHMVAMMWGQDYFASDGMHPNDNGYALWADVIAARLLVEWGAKAEK